MTRRDLQRERVVKLLIEHFRHRPRFLSVEQTVAIVRRMIRHARPAGGASQCVLWSLNCNNDGYGRLSARISGRPAMLYVHRLAVQFAGHVRDIPRWMEASHGCDTPPCFSPLCVQLERRRDNRVKSAINTNRKKARRLQAEIRARRQERLAA